MPLWSVIHFPSFNSLQWHTNEVERKGLAKNIKNLMLSIFGNFELMMWWETKARSGPTTYPFEEEIDHSKIAKVLSGKEISTKYQL